jgi:uncharacterized protein
MALILALSLVIGLLLGLLGGGGSILLVPMLVYIQHVEPKVAVVTTFIIVGTTSFIAILPHARRESVCWQSGILFGLSGMLGAYFSAHQAAQFSATVLMVLFGVVCLFTGMMMLLEKKSSPQRLGTSLAQKCPLKLPLLRLLFDGALVGAFTGLVGVGGGFLIVPALTMLVGLSMQGAVGTSLLVILMNASAGLLGYSQHVDIDWQLTAVVTVGTICGSVLGAWWSGYVSPKMLRKFFGVMVIAIGGYVVKQSIIDWTWQDVYGVLQTVQNKTLYLDVFVGLLVLVFGYIAHKSKHGMHY